MSRLTPRRKGFTLLELLVVVGILAILAGSLLVSYDGLEDDAASAHSGFNTSAADRAIRTFKSLNDSFPNDWDSLLAGDSAADPFVGVLADRVRSDLTTRIVAGTLSQFEIDALDQVGITLVRDLDIGGGATNQYDNDTNLDNDGVALPNRIFDDGVLNTGFYGALRPLELGDSVAIVDSTGELFTLLGFSGFEKIVAFGFGNNSTATDASNSGAVAQVPFAAVAPGEYGRLVALFQVADAGGNPLTEARFLGVVDAKGNLLDESVADFAEGN